MRGIISQIFSHAVRQGLCKGNPARDPAGAIPTPVPRHFASIVEPDKVGKLPRSFDGFNGTYPAACALKLAPMLFVRPGELRKAEWRYTASKTNTGHLAPLATQALTGNGRYLFPGARSAERPMGHATINAALRRSGYETRTEITGHGFRAMARTILHEELEQKPEVIEHQLAHTVPDTLGRAYNRTRFLKERRAMMQLWADYLDRLKKTA